MEKLYHQIVRKISASDENLTPWTQSVSHHQPYITTLRTINSNMTDLNFDFRPSMDHLVTPHFRGAQQPMTYVDINQSLD